MDPCIQVQASSSPIHSLGGGKPWQVKRWFLFFLFLGGLSHGAGQGGPGDPEHEYTCCHIHNIDMVTDSAAQREGCPVQCFPNEVMKKTTEEKDVFVERQQEMNTSETTEHVSQDLIRTVIELDPITCDCRTQGCNIEDCHGAYPNFYGKGKQRWAGHATESVELAQLLPKVIKVQSMPLTSLTSETPELKKKWMEGRFSDYSYVEEEDEEDDEDEEEDKEEDEEEVTLGKENLEFRQSFGEVYRIRNLLKLGESVCKIIVKDVCLGTGFVLFDNFILTNAHLFTDHVDKGNLELDVEVWVVFNYDTVSDTNIYFFTCKNTLIDFDDVQDYAVLELNPEGLSLNPKTTTEKIKVPPGLLKNFGPVPFSGKAYVIGHPGGGVKEFDPTFIIAKEQRVQIINDHLRLYKDNLFTVHTIIRVITEQGIEHILTGGALVDKVVTYKSFMFRGSSGSPVFDALGQVFGLHTAIFHYHFGDQPYIVMGCAHPLHIIFKQFVSKLKETGNYKLLRRVEEETRGNIFLEIIAPLAPYRHYRVGQLSGECISDVCENQKEKGNKARET